MTMTDQPTSSRVRRNQRAVEALLTAAQCIGKIEKDVSIFAVTRGQFSMIDVIRHCVSELGPCRVSVWTWCIADYEIEAFGYLLAEGAISGALLIVDRSAEQRNSALLDQWRDKFGEDAVKVCLNHSKIATIENGTFQVCVRGSANLNANPRFEQIDITEGEGAFTLVKSIEASLPVLRRLSSHRDAAAATGLSLCWNDESLKPFASKGLKIWAK